MQKMLTCLFGLVLLVGSASAVLTNQEVVFLGASITDAFQYPAGSFYPTYNFDKVIIYEADKSSGFSAVQSYNPKIVTFKECAAYFNTGGGTDLNYLKSCMQDIADMCVAHGYKIVPGTTYPVTVGLGGCTQAQLNDIRSFNTWVRSWCDQHNWACMDYYLWIADPVTGQLPAAYQGGDGLHPNQAGYNVIGPHVIPVLDSAWDVVEPNSVGALKAEYR
jgi:hypothetical protein